LDVEHLGKTIKEVYNLNTVFKIIFKIARKNLQQKICPQEICGQKICPQENLRTKKFFCGHGQKLFFIIIPIIF